MKKECEAFQRLRNSPTGLTIAPLDSLFKLLGVLGEPEHIDGVALTRPGYQAQQVEVALHRRKIEVRHLLHRLRLGIADLCNKAPVVQLL